MFLSRVLNTRVFLFFCTVAYIADAAAATPDNKIMCDPPNPAIMENDAIKVSIDTCFASSKFGKITSIYDNNRKATVGSCALFGLRTGILFPYEKKILQCSKDTVTFELGKFGAANFTARLQYALMAHGVNVHIVILCNERIDFTDGLNLDFITNLTTLSCSNHRPNNFICNLDTLPQNRSVVDFEQVVEFSDSLNHLTLVLRNPFHSHFKFNSPSKNVHTLYLLQCAPPSSQPGTASAYSTIDKGDSIIRNVEVLANASPSEPVFFSEQPNGFFNAITMFWDELPNNDHWTPLTTDTATNTPYYRFFLRLIKEDPMVKMGFLLLPDRMVFLPITTFPYWTVNSPYVIFDTIEKKSGSASMAMFSDSCRSRVACQKIPCLPSTAYSLTYYIKTMDVIGSGAYGEVYAGASWIGASSHLFGNTSWQQNGLNFTTGQSDTALSVYLRLQDSKGAVFFDDVNLSPLDADSNMLQNPGFESASGGIRYDNVRRHWTDAHGPERIITQAPRSYLEFLQRIEQHTMTYGWEDKVILGSHGYHHTPSLYEPDPKHEFYYYDPYGDSLRLHNILSETYQMGLTKASLRFMRSPGFEFSKSLLDIINDYGFVFFDASHTSGQPFGAFMLQRNSNHLWLVENSWWADNDSSASAPDRLTEVLKEGHLGVVGGHPEAVFYGRSESSYQRLKGIFSSYEKAYPTLGYVFPNEYADNATSIYALNVKDVERKNKDIIFRFYGATDSGNTVFYLGVCDEVALNGSPVSTKTYDSTTYAILPRMAAGEATLVFSNAVDKPQAAIQHIKHVSASEPLRLQGEPEVTLFNLRGQEIPLSRQRLLRLARGLSQDQTMCIPRGVYILSARVPFKKTRNTCIIIP